MIPLFKKVKKKLIDEKRFNNYLMYAIGEIFLVVIGILIALGINSYNEKRVILKKEQTYLIGLKKEFQISQRKLKELIRVNKESYEGAKILIQYFSDSPPEIEEEELSFLLFNTFAFDISFNPNNSLLNEMISSGSLKDISSPTLRIHLTNWLSTLDDIAQQEKELGTEREGILHFFQNSSTVSIRTVFDHTKISKTALQIPEGENNISNKSLLRSRQFENKLLTFIMTSYFMEKTHYAPLMKDIEFIQKMIEEEIDKN